MAAKAHMALFFERFVKFNLNRYQNDPVYLPLFQGLTLSDVTIDDITEISQPVAGSRRATVTSISRNFRGIEQDWTPAVAETTPKLYTLLNTAADPLADLATAQEQTTPGLYAYLDADGVTVKVVVVIGADVESADFATAVGQVLRAGLKYDIPIFDVPDGGHTVVLTGVTFGGTLEWVQGTAPVIVIPPTYYGVLDGGDDE